MSQPNWIAAALLGDAEAAHRVRAVTSRSEVYGSTAGPYARPDTLAGAGMTGWQITILTTDVGYLVFAGTAPLGWLEPGDLPDQPRSLSVTTPGMRAPETCPIPMTA